MACLLCPGSTAVPATSRARKQPRVGEQAATFRVSVTNATQEAEYRKKYAGYSVLSQSLGSTTVLIFTRNKN